ncbi:MAG: hypothetical protein ACOYXT_00860, partial [Bacteroidota bacterium]
GAQHVAAELRAAFTTTFSPSQSISIYQLALCSMFAQDNQRPMGGSSSVGDGALPVAAALRVAFTTT